MVLVHDPFVPTPDSEAWNRPGRRSERDRKYMKDMVEYTDKIIGRVMDKLEETGLADNTLVLFTGDNGTNRNITTETDHGAITGAKGNTIDHGTRVPLVMHWPAMIREGMVFEGLSEFSDFYPTLGEIVGDETATDGVSFYPLLAGKKFAGRQTAFVHYDPQWGNWVNQFRGQFARTLRYKLYQDGRFYDLEHDVLEEDPLPGGTDPEVRQMLQMVIDGSPEWIEDSVSLNLHNQ
jgi:arylsulfatase A